MNHTHGKQSGEWSTVGFWGEREAGATVSCCHCGGFWKHEPGSGKLRGYCQNCNGFVCGPGCADCVPVERRLENAEAGRPESTPAPASVFVPTWRQDDPRDV